ncbi:N-acetylneuraminate synthase [Patescibacteria group bacterium]|nr:N-acetylneuraminate synthase [Patescibacteria group bacterium]
MIIKIGNREIGPGKPCFIIAEAGVNHNGDVELAEKLVYAAAETGADAVKFQTFKAEQVVVQEALTVAYQKRNTGKDSQIDLLKPLELPESAYPRLIRVCEKAGIMFLSTPHGHIESAEFLRDKVPVWKVASGDLTNNPFLTYLGQSGKPIILSTGYATIEEIKEAVQVIEKTGNKQLVILHCVSNYPCPAEEANVAAVLDLQKHFPDYPIGFSDHTMGIEADIIAAAYGATVIEKHFTLDCSMPGPDQKNSLEPTQFKQMVNSVRLTEKLIGTGLKVPQPGELQNKSIARRSIVAAEDIKKGTIITGTMLTIKRPGTGIEPKMLEQIIGKKASREIKTDELLKPNDWM